jgi:NAD(P)-dependent dehydrogenase (short-subunit alcohol dehydrogenase family)
MSDLITSAFGAASTAREVVAGIDLSGRRAIVTGSASGIGVETARALAEAGAEVTLAVRNLDAGAATAEDLSRTAGAPPRVQRLDLSDLGSVGAFVEAWGEQPLHILIGNAGVMACPLSYTADGLEMQIGTNHFGHYRLGVGLANALERGAQDQGRAARLVSLSSIGHRRGGVNFDDPHYRSRPYDKWEAYGQAKTANALYAVGFPRSDEVPRRHRQRRAPGRHHDAAAAPPAARGDDRLRLDGRGRKRQRPLQVDRPGRRHQRLGRRRA